MKIDQSRKKIKKTRLNQATPKQQKQKQNHPHKQTPKNPGCSSGHVALAFPLPGLVHNPLFTVHSWPSGWKASSSSMLLVFPFVNTSFKGCFFFFPGEHFSSANAFCGLSGTWRNEWASVRSFWILMAYPAQTEEESIFVYLSSIASEKTPGQDC